MLQQFVKSAAERLAGDWVIIGGSVLQLLNIDVRVTTDIDVAGPETATQKDTLALMDIAAEVGLPIEAINQAASYFLHKIPGWKKSLVVVRTGKRGRILRPDASLFIKLKIPRLTSSDLEDCLAMIEFAKEQGEQVDAKSLQKLIRAAIKADENSDRLQRLRTLLKELG